MPLSPRHADLLEKQKGLLEQQRTMQDHLKKLRDVSLVPVPPPTSKPPGKRPVGGIGTLREIKDIHGKQLTDDTHPECGGATFHELRELNTTLSAENTRLNTELSRLLARATQHTGLAGRRKA